ncbi:VOC family protein [Paenibacillus albidus]|uniref:VOC family protein n=1 Tax=Paenibacillus albidus TaxID=2041023 RepID=UPI001BEC83FA|nr:VOC family protein [Paenibacillus albidus]MBT2289427.1 VOC family protein [Paenibacillus albidus]
MREADTIGFTLQFDHVVHYVNQPEQVIEELRPYGISAVHGGRHELIGTYNALSYFDLSYIEWIGVFDHSRLPLGDRTSRYGLIETLAIDSFKEGLSRIALRTHDIEGLAEHLHSQGLEVSGPEEGSRRRPDGTLLKWKLLFAGEAGVQDGLPLPFFIQWEGEEANRKQELQEAGVILPHERGPLQLREVGFTVRRLQETVEKWAEWFRVYAGEVVYDPKLKGNRQTLDLHGTLLSFVEPVEEGLAAEALKSRGQRPFLVGLSSGGPGSKQEYVDIHGSLYYLN